MAAKQPDKVRVADLMRTSVLTVSQNDSMHDAAEKMLSANESAAAVVDEMGRCVGVISSRDFLRFERQQEAARKRIDGGYEFEVVREPGESAHMEGRAFDVVQRHMTPAVQTISAEDSVMTATRYMVDEDIHHLFVLDQGARPVGSLSALEVMVCLMEHCDCGQGVSDEGGATGA